MLLHTIVLHLDWGIAHYESFSYWTWSIVFC